MSNLKQTKSGFKVIGKVSKIDKDFAWKQDQAKKGKREGETFRSLRFGVKTSETNEITVSMFDYEPTEVFMWNSDKKEKDSNYKGDRFPFGVWEEQQEELREQGYAVLQTRVGLTYDENGKIQSKGLPSYVASQEIYNNIENGDSVVVEGEIRYSKYKNAKDEEVEQKSFIIKKLFKLKDIDFEDAKFEEVSYFEQEIVFVDADIDKKEGKAYVTGRTIDFMDNFHDTQMIVNFKNEQGEIDKDMVKLTEAFAKKFKFGDLVTVYGNVVNRVIVKEVEDNDDDKEKDLFAEFGGKKKPTHAQSYTAKTYISEMSIEGIDGYKEKHYTEEDFVKEDIVEDDTLDFGGKGKKNTNPFDNDSEGGAIEISEDDLPF